MKFKTIFIIFNAIIIFSFIFIFSMPFLLFGPAGFVTFVQGNWIAFIIFALVLGFFNFYFISNFRLFTLLEQENWTELAKYLEMIIFEKKRIQTNHLKILLNTYIMTSQIQNILKLEQYLTINKHQMILKYPLQFGIPYLLNNAPDQAEQFFGKLLSFKNLKHKNWVKWNYALSLFQQNQIEAGRVQLFDILDSTEQPLLKLLSLYILKSMSSLGQEMKTRIQSIVLEFKKRYTRIEWENYTEQQKSNIQVLILSKIIEQATDWLFGEPPVENAGDVTVN